MPNKTMELQQLENWLAILICTYRTFPSHGLAKVIHYYLTRVASFEDEYKQCHAEQHYSSLQKYWRWLNKQPLAE